MLNSALTRTPTERIRERDPEDAVTGDSQTSPEQRLNDARSIEDPLAAARLREQVVLQHRSFALGLAHRFEGRGVEREDLEQVALLALVHASRRFDPDRGSRFTAFAAPTIVGEVKRHFRDHAWSVRPPRSLQEAHLEVCQARARLRQELGRDPDDSEVGDDTGRSVSEVREAYGAGEGFHSTSLDAPLSDHDDLALGDTVPTEDEGYDLVERRADLRPLLATLSPREQRVIRLRFQDELTQRQIGRRIGVSQMQVSRILSAAMSRLRCGLLPTPQH